MSCFDARAPCGARLGVGLTGFSQEKFQSTRPVRGATLLVLLGHIRIGVSIHAPRAGRDPA
ncbi:hypothetical protein HMPREF9162_2202 [Selenomonas sp. oral taxon 137 str. F0430]|nr:hypothetical protein HMPREF9162_2202 [Selenomonas sp. oral taxon 137 str. F0430]